MITEYLYIRNLWGMRVAIEFFALVPESKRDMLARVTFHLMSEHPGEEIVVNHRNGIAVTQVLTPVHHVIHQILTRALKFGVPVEDLILKCTAIINCWCKISSTSTFSLDQLLDTLATQTKWGKG